MDIAVVAVISSAAVGAIGIVVPAMTRRSDRNHEVRLEKLQGQVSRAEWVRDHQAQAYSLLQVALNDHRLLDNPPEPDTAAEPKADSPGDVRSTSHSSHVDEVIAWSRTRRLMLENARAEVEPWMSFRVASAWGVLQVAADSFDAEQLTSAAWGQGRSNDEAAEYGHGLASARHEVILRMAIDLQGTQYWAGVDPTDVKAGPSV